jgi:tetratricopeptide (TPR) repeat protein
MGITGRELPQKDLNAFFMRKVLAYVKEHPWEWAAFMAGKVFSVLVGIDFLRSEDVHFYDQFIRDSMYQFLQTWTISILAVLGIALSLFKEPKKFGLLYFYFAAYIFAMFFTYKTRYLISHMPLIIIFSSYAFAVLVQWLGTRDFRSAALLMTAALVLYIGVKWNPIDIVWPSKSEINFVMAMNFDFYGDYERAEEHFKKAIEIYPQNASAMRMLGITYMKKGDLAKAILTLQEAKEIAPDDNWIAQLYDQASAYYAFGGRYVLSDHWSQSFLDFLKKYHTYFRYPYAGIVRQQ